METVEAICNQLARTKLLAPEAVRSIYQRWKSEAREGAADTARFSKWLVSNGFLTDFQVGVLVRGFADLLFLDDYKLIERIGQGRMAGVYKAIHRYGQVVAIKVLPPSKAKHPQTGARFQREARMAARLQHPHVVRTFQIRRTQGGLQYIVMEYLDGETLEEVVQRRGTLPVAETLHVAAQALAGLGHVHAQGFVHRDLKPGNLMLVPRPRETALESQVKILDIGLGRALFDEDAPGDELHLTSDGAVLGTPLYMAPEQARNAHTADIRADLYSLGCVLYFLLTGQPPFLDTSVVRVIVRHGSEAPKPLREFREVPPGLQELMDRLLAKDPSDRFATPAAALEAVKALQSPAKTIPAAQPDPKLRTYLTWLDQTPQPEVEDDQPAPLAVPIARPFAPPPRLEDTSPFENLTDPEPARQRGRWRLARRDVAAAMIGGLALLVVEALVWAVWSWLF